MIRNKIFYWLIFWGYIGVCVFAETGNVFSWDKNVQLFFIGYIIAISLVGHEQGWIR